MKQRGKLNPGHISTISGSGKGHIARPQSAEAKSSYDANYDRIFGSPADVSSEIPPNSVVTSALAAAERGAAKYRRTFSALAFGLCVCGDCQTLGIMGNKPDKVRAEHEARLAELQGILK